MRVLICDDEPDIRMLFRLAFEKVGAEVDEAEDGDDCLKMAAAHEPDLVVLDLHMPKRDGLASGGRDRPCRGRSVRDLSLAGRRRLLRQGRLPASHPVGSRAVRRVT
jgi:DNA-binding LytR/AlgR family response regulator